MKYFTALLGSAALVAAHGWVDNGTIGGQEYEFYQPYMDPYMNPKVCHSYLGHRAWTP